MSTLADTAIIRRPAASDAEALEQLRQRDCGPRLGSDLLVAEVDGRIRAAVRLADGRAIADPFFPTAELVERLRNRAALLHDSPAPPTLAGRHHGLPLALRHRLHRRAVHH